MSGPKLGQGLPREKGALMEWGLGDWLYCEQNGLRCIRCVVATGV